MKRLSLLLLIATMALTGCGKSRRSSSQERSSSTSGATSSTTTTTAATPAPSTGTTTGSPLARVAAHGDPSGEEQELIELMNRARRDPRAEAARLNAAHGLSLDFSGYAPMPPLTPSEQLAQAAFAHSDDMDTRGFYGHVNPDGVNANGRILATTYDLAAAFGTNPAVNLTENIAKGTGTAPGNTLTTPQGVHDTFMIDANVVGTKHRQIILGVGQFSRNREVGVSYLHRPPSDFVTEEFAHTNADRPFVVGVAYDDRDGDGVCRAGEGTPGVPVTLTHASGFSVSTTTATAGGYAFEVLVDGSYTLTIGGRTATVLAQGKSVKVDLASGTVRAFPR
jgi:uncharacterized protein YkwD